MVSNVDDDDDTGLTNDDANHGGPLLTNRSSSPLTASPTAAAPSNSSTRLAPSSSGEPERNSNDPKEPVSQQMLLTEAANNLGDDLLDPELHLPGFEFYSDESSIPSGIARSTDQLLDLFASPGPTASNIWQIFAQDDAPVPDQTHVLFNCAGPAPTTTLEELQQSRPTVSSPNERPQQGSSITMTSDEYDKAVAKLAEYSSSFQLPSKHAMIRFVRAFFEQMAPQFPVLHRPTFDMASVPSK